MCELNLPSSESIEGVSPKVFRNETIVSTFCDFNMLNPRGLDAARYLIDIRCLFDIKPLTLGGGNFEFPPYPPCS